MKLNDLVIIGAGGFGREIFEYVQDSNADSNKFNFLGFLDDDAVSLSNHVLDGAVLGPLEMSSSFQGTLFVIALGDPSQRHQVAQHLNGQGHQLATVIHPTAYVSRSATVDPGVIAAPFTLFGAYSWTRANVAVNVYASVGHDASVGSHSVLSPYAAITGNCRVGEHCFLGTKAVLTPGTEIGRYTKVATGSIVTSSTPPGYLLNGNPARGREMFAFPDVSED